MRERNGPSMQNSRSNVNGSGYVRETAAMNSHEFQQGILLGELRAESSRHTEILLGIHDRLIDLPEDLAGRLATHAPPAKEPEPAGVLPLIKASTEFLRALLPLCLIGVAMAAKLSMPERMALIRQAIQQTLGMM